MITAPDRQFIATLLFFACIAVNAADTASTSSLAQLTRLVGDGVISDIGEFRDCSQAPVGVLDAQSVSEESTTLAQLPFTWAKVAFDGGTCIYLEKPERRGLTSDEAHVLMTAASRRIDFPIGAQTSCPRADIRDNIDPEPTDETGRENGVPYTFTFANAADDLAPFGKIQRQFADRQKRLLAAQIKASSTDSQRMPRTLGVSFQLLRSGELASLTADIVVTRLRVERTFAGWLLHIPSGRILAFDDLFVDPQAARALVATKARMRMAKSFKDMYVREHTEAQRQATGIAIDQRLAEVTDPARASAWWITLDTADACQPGLRITFDGASLTPLVDERPEARLGMTGIRDLLKPEFRDALPEPMAQIQVKPPFTDEVVASLFPALMRESSRQRLPLADLQSDLVDCSDNSVEFVQYDPNALQSLWMYNGLYRWGFRADGDGTCVFLTYPEQRGLSREEAWLLLSAAKRKLPFDESKLDPAFQYEFPVDVAQAFGGLSTFEHGAANGVAYATGFVGTDAALAPLNVIQHRAAQAQIVATAKRASRHHAKGHSSKDRATLVMDFVAGGRTGELAVLALEGTRMFADGESELVNTSWILHVPSGRLIELDDLFIDPMAVRKKISDDYRGSIPSRMGFYAFVGDDASAKGAAFRAVYRRTALRSSTPTAEHFRNVRLSAAPDGHLSVQFSNDALARDDYASGGASFKWLRPHLRPKYGHALDLAPLPNR